MSISNIVDDEWLCFRHTSKDIDIAEGLQNPTRVMVLTNLDPTRVMVLTSYDPTRVKVLTNFDPTRVIVLTSFDPTRVMVLTNWFDGGEFFVGLVFDTSYYSELWLINMVYLADKIWYDDRNTTMDGYDKFIGDNFNLEEFKETFFDKFTGIQRTAQIYYDKSYQMDGGKYYSHCTVLVTDSACLMERWNPSILDQYYGTV